MTPRQQQARRRQLHAMAIAKLRVLYADTTGHLISETRKMFTGLDDDGRQIMVDAIIEREVRR